MTSRYLITLGALTTAGGKVITANSRELINGVNVACENDSVMCPKCNSVGIIKLDGPRLSDTVDGLEVALDNDLCICKCSPPPRLLPSQRFVMQTIDGDWHGEEAAATASEAEKLNTASESTATDPHRIPILLLDPDTNEPFKLRPYRLDLKDKVIEGTTDQNGGNTAAHGRGARRCGHLACGWRQHPRLILLQPLAVLTGLRVPPLGGTPCLASTSPARPTRTSPSTNTTASRLTGTSSQLRSAKCITTSGRGRL